MSLALRPAETSTMAIWCDGVFKRYKGVLRLEVNVLRQAGPRNVCMRSVQPCLPSPKRRVDSSIIAAKVRALLVRTGEAFGVYPSGALPGGFSPHSRDAASVELSLHPTREWSRDDRRGNRLGSVASADGGACCAWPLLVGRKAEDGASQDTRASPERGGDRPRARTRTYERPYETSLLEMGRRESSLRNKDKASRECCQARGTKVRIIHHREG